MHFLLFVISLIYSLQVKSKYRSHLENDDDDDWTTPGRRQHRTEAGRRHENTDDERREAGDDDALRGRASPVYVTRPPRQASPVYVS